MIKIIVLASFIFSVKLVGAQELPLPRIREHLIKSGELTVNEAKEDENLTVTKLLGNDNIAVFQFRASSAHGYYFALLKINDKYKILNCHNLGSDIEDIETAFVALGAHYPCDDLFRLLNLYKTNENIHGSPPKPIFKEGKFTGETRYPPRKVIPTDFFIWKR